MRPPLSSMRSWLIATAMMLAAVLGMAEAGAKPVQGQIVQHRLQLDDGVLVALPEGRWRVADQRDYRSSTDIAWHGLVLLAEDPASAIPMLAIRHTAQRVAWGRSPCEETVASAFLVDTHGSLPSQLVARCSRSYALRRFSDWARGQQSHEWWRHLLGPAVTDAKWGNEGVVLDEIWVRRWNGPGLWIGAFIRSEPAGIDPIKLRDAAQAGREEAVHTSLRQWTATFVEANAAAFLDGSRATRVPALGPVLAAHGDAIHERIRQAVDNRKDQAASPPSAPGKAAAPSAIGATGAPAVAAAGAGANRPTPIDDEAIRERIRQMTERERGGSREPAAAPQKPAAPVASPAPSPPAASSPPTAAAPPKPAASAASPAPAVATAAGASVDQLAAEVARLREELRRQQAQGAPAPAAVAQPARVEPARATPAITARRLAFVIGIDAYTRVTPLQNARADARAIAERLTRLGYAVTLRTDLGERALRDELRTFRNQVQGGDEVVFFFAGHGVQLAGANYLLPADIRGDSEDQVRDDALPLQKVLDEIQERKARFTLAMIDACRDNPFRASGRAIGTRGLAPTTAATGQMVMFSAGAGQQALDRLGPEDRDPNGLFTRVLLARLDRQGVSIDRLMREVRTEVVSRARAIGHEQVPALYDQSIGEFFFRP